jgi:hypothetical protein
MCESGEEGRGERGEREGRAKREGREGGRGRGTNSKLAGGINKPYSWSYLLLKSEKVLLHL